jgi:hypothetical protein
MRRALLTVVFGSGLLPLAACSADAADFQVSAEKLIESQEGATRSGTSFHDARCERPGKVQPGIEFTCTATDAGGTLWEFNVVVKDSKKFELTGAPQG